MVLPGDPSSFTATAVAVAATWHVQLQPAHDPAAEHLQRGSPESKPNHSELQLFSVLRWNYQPETLQSEDCGLRLEQFHVQALQP